MNIKKQIIINVSDSVTGNLMKTITNFEFVSLSKSLNAGCGECVINMAVPFDYDGQELALGNDVEIRISDKDTIAGSLALQDTAGSKVIYTGYISLIERNVQGEREGLTVHMLGHYTKLQTDILKNSAQTTLYSKTYVGLTITSGDLSSADIGLLMRSVIDRYRAETVNPKIGYIYDDVPNTGTVATYSFAQKTYREAMEILKRMAPLGMYYYIDPVGNLKFKQSASTPKHLFIFGKHFRGVRVEQSMEKVRNGLLVWNGQTGGSSIYKSYSDADSILRYGRRTETFNDYGINNVDGADLIGAKFIDENKRPDIKVTCEIIDNSESTDRGYDIESIEPGDTCSFLGFKVGVSDIFKDNMIITSVTYFLDKVQIEVEIVKAGILDIQNQQSQAISDIGSGGLGVPESYI